MLTSDRWDSSRTNLAVEEISQTVDCLYRISVQLARKSSNTQHAKAEKIDVLSFEPFDREYCQEKFPDADDLILNRMAKAISRRRQLLRYRETHAFKLAQRSNDDENSDAEERKTVLSETTATTFIEPSDAILTKTQDDAASVMSATTYSSLVGAKLRMPTIPKAAADDRPFLCPICHKLSQLDSARLTHEWTKHVFRDLQPYFCTFSGCDLREQTFESRHQWFYHELKSHRQRWICRGHCDQVFAAQNHFEDHVRASRPHGISPKQISTYLDICEISIGATDEAQCPLCHDLLRGPKQVEKHIGRHMEEVALFALPQSMFSSSDTDTDGSSSLSSFVEDVDEQTSVLPPSAWKADAEEPSSHLGQDEVVDTRPVLGATSTHQQEGKKKGKESDLRLKWDFHIPFTSRKKEKPASPPVDQTVQRTVRPRVGQFTWRASSPGSGDDSPERVPVPPWAPYIAPIAEQEPRQHSRVIEIEPRNAGRAYPHGSPVRPSLSRRGSLSPTDQSDRRGRAYDVQPELRRRRRPHSTRSPERRRGRSRSRSQHGTVLISGDLRSDPRSSRRARTSTPRRADVSDDLASLTLDSRRRSESPPRPFNVHSNWSTRVRGRSRTRSR